MPSDGLAGGRPYRPPLLLAAGMIAVAIASFWATFILVFAVLL